MMMPMRSWLKLVTAKMNGSISLCLKQKPHGVSVEVILAIKLTDHFETLVLLADEVLDGLLGGQTSALFLG